MKAVDRIAFKDITTEIDSKHPERLGIRYVRPAQLYTRATRHLNKLLGL